MTEEPKNEAAEGAAGNAFLELAPQAIKEHIKFESASIIPEFRTFVSDIDVHVGLYGFTVHAGAYFLHSGDELNEALVYKLVFDPDDLIAATNGVYYDETTDEGTGVTLREYKAQDENGANVSFPAKLEPIATKNGGYLTYVEYAAWLTMNTAPDDETRRAVFNSAYQVKKPEAGSGEELPQQDTARPRYRQDPKTKIARLIGMPESGALLYDGARLTVASEKERARGVSVEQIVLIEYMGDEGIVARGREQITQFDRQVNGSIISHYNVGNRIVSLNQVCELVYGHTKPSEEQRRAVEESIERQMWTRISINMADEAAKHTLKRPDLLTEFKIEGQMLAVRKISARAANGKKIIAYQLLGEPILYTHALITGQLTTYSAKLLQAPKGMKNTEKTMAIRQTLLEEVRRAKDGKRNKFMKYDTIFKDSGQIPKKGTERSRQIRDVRRLLDMFKEHGEISGWEEKTEGRKITGFEVSFPAKTKTRSNR